MLMLLDRISFKVSIAERLLKVMPITSSVVILRENGLQQEGVLSHFYMYIIFQRKLNLVVMASMSKKSEADKICKIELNIVELVI